MEPQICPVVRNHPRAESTFYGVLECAVVGVVLNVGGHMDLVVFLDVVVESDEVMVVGATYDAVVAAGPL